MYTQKALGHTSLLWFVSGIGWTGNWSIYENQRRGTSCEMLPFMSMPRRSESDTDLDIPGDQRRDAPHRVVYLN